MSAEPRPLRPRKRLVFPVAACIAGLLVPVVALDVGPVPGLPNIPAVPGQQTARFTVVVEGSALATKDEVRTSPDPTRCSVDIRSRLEEKTEYLRGKGVLMEFVRPAPGAPVFIQRAGRAGDASLAVRATTTRTSTGTARRFGSVPEACPPVAEDLAASPDCAKPDVNTTKLGLLYQGRLPKLSSPAPALSTLSSSECGATTLRGGVESLSFSWVDGVPAPLAPATLSPSAIFGSKKVLLLRMISVPKVKGPETVALDNLNGTVTEKARNRATVRLVRVP